MSRPKLPRPDVVVVGAGVIGLATALELQHRGAQVAVIERDTALSHASTAAAGMLAAYDPFNPPALSEFAKYSVALYADFLHRIETLSQRTVPFQTSTTHQYMADGNSTVFNEHSIDPRQLAGALAAAAMAAGVDIQEYASMPPITDTPVICASGAWSAKFSVAPRKGQMLRVQLPLNSLLDEVHRAEHVYVVPRTLGPQAGTALIGATVEDAGFEVSTDDISLSRLRDAAANLNEELRFLADAPTIEAWAGLRPATPDLLPVIGRVGEREFVATGHFRNGILLAPGTAKVIADLIENRQPAVDLHPFRAERPKK